MASSLGTFDTGLFERAADDYLPFVQHVSPENVLCDDGSVATAFHVPGNPFELETHRERNVRRRQLNALWRSIADTNLTVATHLVRHPRVVPPPSRLFRSRFAGQLDEAYQRAVLDGRLMTNDWFLTLVVSPRVVGSAAPNRLRRWLGRNQRVQAGEALGRQLEDISYVVDRFFAPDGGRRLGYRREGPFLYSEFAEAMRLVLTARWWPVPLTSGSLGSAIYTHRAIVGPRGIEIREPGRTAFGTIRGLRVYPAQTVTGQLNKFCAASLARGGGSGTPYALVLSQTFRPRSRAQSQTSMTLQSVRLHNSGDKARSEIEAIEDAQDDVASSRTVMGEHNLTLAVYADRLADLPAVSADAAHLFTAAGANSAQEERGAFAAYWSQLPGNPSYLRGREGLISSRNFAALSSFDTYPVGASEGYWGPPLIRFRTSGGTAYDFHPHVEEVGHTLFLGRTGSGKTLLLCLLIAMLEAAVERTGTVLFFDKDRGGEPIVRATGGRYLALRRGRASGLAPMRALPDTPEDRAHLVAMFSGLTQLDGKGGLSRDEERGLARGVARVMRLPVEKRWMAGVRQFMGFTDPNGAGARFEKWCRGGTNGWLFDNAEDEVRLDANLVGFDLTELLPKDERAADDGVCGAAAEELIYRARKLMDGRRMAVICDECRFYLPTLAKVFEDFALTGRKKEVMIWLAAQYPEHILDNPDGPSLVAQCPTVIAYPSKKADRASYMKRLGFTAAEFRQVTEEMPVAPERSFLIKRESGSVVVRYGLDDMREFIPVLSGREKSVRVLDEIRAALGDDDAGAVAAEFMRRMARPGAPVVDDFEDEDMEVAT